MSASVIRVEVVSGDLASFESISVVCKGGCWPTASKSVESVSQTSSRAGRKAVECRRAERTPRHALTCLMAGRALVSPQQQRKHARRPLQRGERSWPRGKGAGWSRGCPRAS